MRTCRPSAACGARHAVPCAGGRRAAAAAPPRALAALSAQLASAAADAAACAAAPPPLSVAVAAAALVLTLGAGSVTGGLVARQRGIELKAVVTKLRLLNESLKKSQLQAKLAARKSATAGESPLDARLTAARNLLNDRPAESLAAFLSALESAKAEAASAPSSPSSGGGLRKALRGCAAARERLGDHRSALADMKQVLDLCARAGERSAEVEALGKVADLCTELGDYDEAGRYYDLLLEKDGFAETVPQ